MSKNLFGKSFFLSIIVTFTVFVAHYFSSFLEKLVVAGLWFGWILLFLWYLLFIFVAIFLFVKFVGIK